MESMTLLNSTSRLFVLVVLATLLAITPQLGRPRPVAAAALAPSVCIGLNCTYTVTNAADTPDANPGDLMCADLNGNCTLRAAIDGANADPGYDITIIVPANITLTPLDPTLGTLTLKSVPSSITIIGAGSATTIITEPGPPTFGIMVVNSSANVSLVGLTIKGGSAVNGGGIANSGTLNVTNSTLSNNTATKAGQRGGGIENEGPSTLTVINSTFSSNKATYEGGATVRFLGLKPSSGKVRV